MSENVTNEEDSQKKTVGFKETPHIKSTYSNSTHGFYKLEIEKLNTKGHRRLFTHIQSVFSSVL